MSLKDDVEKMDIYMDFEYSAAEISTVWTRIKAAIESTKQEENKCLGCKGGSVHHTCGKEPDTTKQEEIGKLIERFTGDYEKYSDFDNISLTVDVVKSLTNKGE